MDFDDYNDGFAASSVYTGASYEPRRRRSRSRDRSVRRDRRRSRSYDRDRRSRSRRRDRSYSRSRSRSRSRDRRRSGGRSSRDNPKRVIMRGVPRGCGENAVWAVMDSIAMYVGTVAKLSMDGSSAIIDMETDEGAKMLAMYGTLEVDGTSCTLDPCFKAEKPAAPQKEKRHSDWICMQCNTMNFARRQECFQCQAPKIGNSVPVEDTAPTLNPLVNQESDTTLLVREIVEHATELSIRTAFNPFGQLYEVRYLPERNLAFVEFENPSHVKQAMRQVEDQGVRVEGSYVTVTVARGRENAPAGDNPGAQAAIEQAMAMAQGRRRGLDANPEGVDGKATSKFKLDPKTGFHYNPETEQYYDEKSGVYYTHKGGKSFYFDPTKSDYVECAAIGSTLPPGSGVIYSPQSCWSRVANRILTQMFRGRQAALFPTREVKWHRLWWCPRLRRRRQG
eukprot:TRINITY_DN6566_c0_g1_i1.p1 TRINITY_DN6566_c0_g1~~TRINITY_DN6566_c0_g1_i1.p1  ORF type:complete len:450 (+),score=55.27 TRINITY_DN6566_c0_g1_i1:82-1431(+)